MSHGCCASRPARCLLYKQALLANSPRLKPLPCRVQCGPEGLLDEKGLVSHLAEAPRARSRGQGARETSTRSRSSGGSCACPAGLGTGA